MSSPSVQSLKIESPALQAVRDEGIANMPGSTIEKDAGIYISDDTKIDKAKLVIPLYYKVNSVFGN